MALSELVLGDKRSQQPSQGPARGLPSAHSFSFFESFLQMILDLIPQDWPYIRKYYSD